MYIIQTALSEYESWIQKKRKKNLRARDMVLTKKDNHFGCKFSFVGIHSVSLSLSSNEAKSEKNRVFLIMC